MKKKEKYYLYLITCLTNKKQYIGQTTTTVNLRWSAHKSCARSHRHDYPLYNAINKYGADSFTIQTLCECNTQEELDTKEQEAITTYNTLSPKGYNLALGGRGGKHSKETIEKLRQITKNSSPALKRRRAEGIRRFHKDNPDFYKSTEQQQIRSKAAQHRWKNLDKKVKDNINEQLALGRQKLAAIEPFCSQGLRTKRTKNKYVGVYQNSPNCWMAVLQCKGTRYYAYGKTEEEAAKLYDEIAIKVKGDKARLNFPLPQEK